MIAGADEVLEGYGMRQRGRSRVIRPVSRAEIARAFAEASAAGESIGIRGAGCSYGDAALNTGHVVLDCARLNRIVEWLPETGEITCEPGVTIEQLWRHVLSAGWWPPVCPGTMAVTVGGAAAGNIHGKNQWRDGGFGEHIMRFEMMLPDGEVVACSPTERRDLYFGAIGGWGLLGCFVSITLRMRRIYSGLVHVTQTPHSSLPALIDALEAGTATATHLVGWIDTGSRGPHLGRGLLKAMREPAPGEDPDPVRTLDPERQPPSTRIAGVLPTTWIPTLARPLASPAGIWLANWGQWLRGNLPGASAAHYERYVPANFMLNFIPHFKDIYRPGGLIQQQTFAPRASAVPLFEAMLDRSRRAGLAPSLAVLKKHRPSPFLLNYLPDGYSLALDYAVPTGTEKRTLAFITELNALVAEHGGTFFLAKDSTLAPDDFRRAFDTAALDQFARLKERYDPGELLQTDIYRRVLRPALRRTATSA